MARSDGCLDSVVVALAQCSNDGVLRQRVIAKNLSPRMSLVCFTCGFDYLAAYGEQGAGCFECHHTAKPVGGEAAAPPENVILICANCHRMIHQTNPCLSPDQLLEVTSSSYDRWRGATERASTTLTWSRTDPQEPECYDAAYEAEYNDIVFRAIRSRSAPTSWRLERDKSSTRERQGGISHEESLLACKKRVEREIAENGWFAQ